MNEYVSIYYILHHIGKFHSYFPFSKFKASSFSKIFASLKLLFQPYAAKTA